MLPFNWSNLSPSQKNDTVALEKRFLNLVPLYISKFRYKLEKGTAFRLNKQEFVSPSDAFVQSICWKDEFQEPYHLAPPFHGL